ncbi:Hypothetical predicted protein [Olea europaea subsp. europaea]|uniref:Uncharacterized protein n=1 Tax=Olea europaea subsp. europaea TaxID=158383 RepID=A0A8S0RRN8_OLEEU|nr:Hypothetical predicted protein [Olea europaea subsp. europaea]
MSVRRRERYQPRRDRASDCGVRGADGDRKRGASGERSEGRDREEKLLQRREGVNFGVRMESAALVLVWSQPSVIAVRAYLMSVQRKERSQPRSEQASDFGVRGARGYRNSDGVLCASSGTVAPVSNCGPSVFDVNPAQGAISTAEGPGQRLWGPRSRWRSKAKGRRGALGGAG